MRLPFARVLLVAVVLAVQPALAEPLISAEPASVGFATDRLQRLTDTLEAEIGKGTIPGAVQVRNGKAASFQALGALDPDKKAEAQGCDLSRIAQPIATDRRIGVGTKVNDPRELRKYELGGGGLVSTIRASLTASAI
jgi:hypothetical protein